MFCSALDDECLPQCRALFIGGGFPETHAARLSGNRSFKESIKAAADEGLPIYAECGGLMYLGRNIVVDGVAHPMAGIFPVDFTMRKKPQGHGYTACRVSGSNAFFKVGDQIKAHEFHYSQPSTGDEKSLRFAYRVLRGKGVFGDQGGMIYKNVLGTYHHVHALGTPGWAPAVMRAARRS